MRRSLFGSTLVRRATSALLLAAVAMAAPAFGQARDITNAGDPYRHVGTSTAFSLATGDFRRSKVAEYNASGTDASATYDLVRSGEKLMSITMYIYPMGASTGPSERSALCRDEYAGIKNAITRSPSYSNVSLRAEDLPGSPYAGVRAEGYHASYTFTSNFAGSTMKVRSDAYLYCSANGRWFVQYRATWPATRTLEGDLFVFMALMRWNDSVSR